METVTFQTFDEVNIFGDWYPSPTTIGVVILLHMMPADRKSWAPFQEVLLKHHLASLAIDLRGHGESVTTKSGGKLDYKAFTDEQHRQCLHDVMAAVDWLVAKKYEKSQIMIGGGSIGGNLAVWMLEQDPELAGAFCLSPGNYRGIDAFEQAGYLKSHHSLWTAGSDTDDPEAYETARKMMDEAGASRKTFVPYKNAGHGTHLFSSDPELMENLASWIEESLQTPLA